MQEWAYSLCSKAS